MTWVGWIVTSLVMLGLVVVVWWDGRNDDEGRVDFQAFLATIRRARARARREKRPELFVVYDSETAEPEMVWVRWV